MASAGQTYGLMADEPVNSVSSSSARQNGAGAQASSSGMTTLGYLMGTDNSKKVPKDARDMMGDDGKSSSSFLSSLKAGASQSFSVLESSVKSTTASLGTLIPTSLPSMSATMGASKKSEDNLPDPGSYVPPGAPGGGDYVRFGALAGSSATQPATSTVANGSTTVSATSVASGSAAPSALAPEPRSHAQAGAQEASGGPAQLRCYACTTVMSHQIGAVQVKCPTCGTINACPSAPSQAGASNGTISVSCASCRKLTACEKNSKAMTCPSCGTNNSIVQCQNSGCSATLSCKSTTTAVSCPSCGHVSRSINQGGSRPASPGTVHASCVGCGCRLQMPATAAAVSCPRCRTITSANDPRARLTPASAPVAAGGSSPSTQSEEELIQEAIRRSLGQELSTPSQPAPNLAPVVAPLTSVPAAASRRAAVDDATKARALTTFCDVTGCEPNVATTCLEATNWQVDIAVNSYLEQKNKRKSSSKKKVGHRSPQNASRVPSLPSLQEESAGALEEEAGQAEIEWEGLTHFMASLGLEKYTEILEQQELTDPDSLRDVTDEDLKEMNITTIGARRKLLAGIRKLNDSKVVVKEPAAPAAKEADLLNLLN